VASAAIVEHQAETQSTTRAADGSSSITSCARCARTVRTASSRSTVANAWQASATLVPMRHLHLTHPRLGSWVTVEIHERDGRFMATADLGEDSRDIGVGDTPQEAVRAALRSLGEP